MKDRKSKGQIRRLKENVRKNETGGQTEKGRKVYK